MKKISYRDNTLNHHSKTLLHNVIEGIRIDDKMYRIEEFLIKDDGLYSIVTDEHDFYEIQLSGSKTSDGYDDTYLRELIDQIKKSNEDKLSVLKNNIDNEIQELKNKSSIKSPEYLEIMNTINSMVMSEISVGQIDDTIDVVPVEEPGSKLFKIGISQKIKNTISSLTDAISGIYTKEQSDSRYYSKEYIDDKFVDLSGFSTYLADYSENFSSTGTRNGYRTLSYNEVANFGLLHLDFSSSNAIPYGTRTEIAQLPSNSPTPRALIETSGYYNNRIYLVYIEEGSRTVYGHGLPADVRLCVDLVGFWRSQ